MEIDNLDSFDKMVSKVNTLKLTNNTLKITELPDDFEPKHSKIEDITNSVP